MMLNRFIFFYCYGDHRDLHVLTHSFPTRRSADLFDGRAGFEALDAYGMALVTLDEKAEAAGINDVTLGFGGVGIGASLDASAFTTDLTVAGYGNIATGSGDDDVTVTSGPEIGRAHV